jgi:hypothetical protein
VAANQIGDADYKPASQVTKNLTVGKGDQTIGALTFNPATLRVGGTATVNATASTDLPLIFSSNTSDICTVNGTTVTGVKAGTCTVSATQDGSAVYRPVSIQGNIGVEKGGKDTQTIDLKLTPPTLTVGATTTITATSTSGLEVILQSNTPSFCMVSGTTVTGLKIGTCTISANQEGNANYFPADQMTQDLDVAKGKQIINFDELPSKTFGDPPFMVNANSSSGLPVSFMGLTPEVCTATPTAKITGVRLVGTGICTLQASQSGNSKYDAAPTVQQSFNVVPRIAMVTLDNLTQVYNGKKRKVKCSARVYGSQQVMLKKSITYTDVGSGSEHVQIGKYGVQCEVATTGYSGSASGTLEIVPAADKVIQSITLDTLPSKTLGDDPFPVIAVATSGLPISFSAVGTKVCSVSGDTVTLLGVGTCVIKASQTGNANYQAAKDQYLTFEVLP